MRHENNPEFSENRSDEETVVSVWYGDHNTKLSRRRQFEGYTFVETLNEAGKKEMHSIYTGDWHIQQLTRRERNLHRFSCTGLWLVGVALLIIGLTRFIGINYGAAGALPGFVGMVGLGWTMTGLFNEFTVPQKRTIGDYRASHLRTMRGSIIALCGSLLTAVLTLIWISVDGEDAGLHLLAAGCELVAAAVSAGIFLMERKVQFTKERSDEAGKYLM